MQSELFGASADLAAVASGGRVIRSPESSDSVALIQEALIALGFALPDRGIDDSFGQETGSAVTAYKQSRLLQPSDAVVGVGTTNRIDLEIAYLEGNGSEDAFARTEVLALDPALAGFVDIGRPELNITKRITDFFEFGDRICLRMSFVLGSSAAAAMGKIAEDAIFDKDYTLSGLHSPALDFMDRTPSSTPYVDFLLMQHPGIDSAAINDLGQKKRPDLLRNQAAGPEWYEIKPMSIPGAIAARVKLNEIRRNYAAVGLPYEPGTAYTPQEFIPLVQLVTDVGEQLDIVLHVRRVVPALIFWEFCVKGDYVRYFNRVRLLAGTLALLAVLAELLLPAAEAGAIVVAIRQLAVELGAGLLPILLGR